MVCGGLGVFNIGAIKKFQCVSTYFGEVVPGEESCRRGKIAEIDGHVYMFALTEELSIDAKYKANKSRFINHSKKPNIFAKTIYSLGDFHVSFYSLQDIPPGN